MIQREEAEGHGHFLITGFEDGSRVQKSFLFDRKFVCCMDESMRSASDLNSGNYPVALILVYICAEAVIN